MEEVEKLFVHNFAKDDKKKAMMLLMPAQKKACHAITYFVGMFIRCICFTINNVRTRWLFE